MLGLEICSNVRSANIKTNYKINFKKHPNPKHSKAPKVENQELNKQMRTDNSCKSKKSLKKHTTKGHEV